MDIATTQTFFVIAFTSLFTIINPFSTASVFLTITKGDSKKEKTAMAKTACLAAALILVVFAFGGTLILDFFNISLDAFKIAAGLLVAGVGIKMIHSKREHFHSPKHKKQAMEKEDISIVPLAIPMMSGPGAMTAAIVLAGESTSNLDTISLIAAIIAVCLLTYIILANSNIISKYLKETGQQVINKVMGLIVLVIGVQFIINGITNILSGIL